VPQHLAFALKRSKAQIFTQISDSIEDVKSQGVNFPGWLFTPLPINCNHLRSSGPIASG
jgi:hypothetical protein